MALSRYNINNPGCNNIGYLKGFSEGLIRNN